MNLNDLSRLKVLMNKTLSGSDAEALTALRSANEILRKHDLDWVKVLSRVWAATVERGSIPPESPRRRADIEDLLGRLERDRSEFVVDVREQFERTGTLSDRQIEALERIAER
jgi:hypothetical protein